MFVVCKGYFVKMYWTRINKRTNYHKKKKLIFKNFCVFTKLKQFFLGVISRSCLKHLMFGTYFDQDSDVDKRYEEVTNIEQFFELANDCLQEYNATHKSKMDIVLFEYALEHLSKICRVLSMSCGSTLLVICFFKVADFLFIKFHCRESLF